MIEKLQTIEKLQIIFSHKKFKILNKILNKLLTKMFTKILIKINEFFVKKHTKLDCSINFDTYENPTKMSKIEFQQMMSDLLSTLSI